MPRSPKDSRLLMVDAPSEGSSGVVPKWVSSVPEIVTW